MATSTEKLAKDVDAAIRKAHCSLRVVLEKLDDLKIDMIQQPTARPFDTTHDQMYNLFLELSRKVQATRAELRDRHRTQVELQLGPPLQPQLQLPVPAPEITPVAGVGVRIGMPNGRKRSQPFVLVPVSLCTFCMLVGRVFLCHVATNPDNPYHTTGCCRAS